MSDQHGALQERVQELLASTAFRERAATFDRRELIRMTNSLGGPPMRLLHARTLADLGRIPHSDEDYAVDAISGIDAHGAPSVEVFMVSHRWLRPSRNSSDSHPDGLDHEKAAAIEQFTQWRRQWVRERHGFDPEIFYWIDYSCIDQRNTIEAVPLLPLWVACCERFLRVETPDYDQRVWCRLEPLLGYVFSFADHQVSIGLDFHYRWPHLGSREAAQLLDPRGGQITDPADLEKIAPLVEMATRIRPSRVTTEQVRFGESVVTCFRL